MLVKLRGGRYSDERYYFASVGYMVVNFIILVKLRQVDTF